RGAQGGLAITTEEVADLLEAFGFERVLVETVGVGQTELDIARTAETTALVLVPESGDGIQPLRAGDMEVADISVANKAYRADAGRPGTRVEALAPGGDAGRGAAGTAAGRGSGRPAQPVRRGGRDPRSGEGWGGRDPMSRIEKKPVYTPDDLAGFDPSSRLGAPGGYPFTRGIHPTMYRGKLWTMRQFAGF